MEYKQAWKRVQGAGMAKDDVEKVFADAIRKGLIAIKAGEGGAMDFSLTGEGRRAFLEWKLLLALYE